MGEEVAVGRWRGGNGGETVEEGEEGGVGASPERRLVKEEGYVQYKLRQS